MNGMGDLMRLIVNQIKDLIKTSVYKKHFCTCLALFLSRFNEGFCFIFYDLLWL